MRPVIISAVFVFVLVSLAGAEQRAFNVSRFVICSNIEDKEPTGISNEFKSSRKRVYAFFEATDITSDTQVRFIWYYEDKEAARIDLPLMKSARWRTYSSKVLGDRKGRWKVELLDEGGNTIETVEFNVK